MDKLLASFLTVIFLYGYSYVIMCILFILMFTNILDTSPFTLLILTLITIYNIYGLTGIFVVLLSMVSFVISGYMYFFNTSINGIINLIDTHNDRHKNTLYLKSIYDKSGISHKNMKYIKNTYTDISLKYDTICSNIYTLLCNFRKITEDIIPFKQTYDLIDTLLETKIYINKFYDLFNINSLYNHKNSLYKIPINIDDNNTKQENISSEHNSSLFGNNLDFSNIMSFNQQMEQQLLNLHPEQKKQLDKMAMDMMGGLFGNLANKH